MKWSEVRADWQEFEKQFQSRWPKLTDADLEAIAGGREKLVVRLESIYKADKLKLDKDVDTFVRRLRPLGV